MKRININLIEGKLETLELKLKKKGQVFNQIEKKRKENCDVEIWGKKKEN